MQLQHQIETERARTPPYARPFPVPLLVPSRLSVVKIAAGYSSEADLRVPYWERELKGSRPKLGTGHEGSVSGGMMFLRRPFHGWVVLGSVGV